jgi:hypothetical protein
MPNEDSHISDRDLLLAADGELSAHRAAEIRAHLEACWPCRTRAKDLEDAIAGFVHAHRAELDPRLPSAEGSRALLRARLNEAAAAPVRGSWMWASWHRWAYACSIVALAGTAVWLLHSPQPDHRLSGLIPDPRLTPGAALPVSQADVCSEQLGDRVRFIPASMGQKVFEEYGIPQPTPRAYELDYLIDPELGGADDVRNFWPQPYSASGWNSHLKDALEDRLHELVCEHKISLATAQRDISSDWISAYKKYFQTDRPIASHSAFTKDRPWEP